MANMTVQIVDSNNVTIEVTPTAEQVISVSRGLVGPEGSTGPPGPQGTGQGVPVGGTTGQALVKLSSEDYATDWETITPAVIGAATTAQGALADTSVQPGDLATVATTGGYGDLTGKPTLGTAAATNSTDYATAAQGVKADSAVQPGALATVATTGSYTDLTNKPSIPAAQVNSDWNAGSGVAQILNKPALATVATTGAYNDLTGKPTLGTAAAANTTDFATAAQGTKADTALQPAAIGTTVQAYDPDLTSWAAITPSTKQDTLVSGTNIKTINGTSLLGSGDIAISSGSGTVTSVATGTGLTGGPISTTGTIALANTAVTAGSYTSANITVDAQGRITAAANGSGGGGVSSFNTRTGAVTLSSSDVTTALGYTPTPTSRVVALTDATSLTVNADITDIGTQANTQAAGTLTINAPTGTPSNGQRVMVRLTSTNVQTFSWNAIFQGSTDQALPTASSGSSKIDYMGFIYNSTGPKWQLIAKNFGF